MPTSLTGSSAGIADGDAASTNIPADTDALNSASVTTAFQYLLNRAKYLLDFVTKAHTWTAAQAFSLDVTLDSGHDYKYSAAVTRHVFIPIQEFQWKDGYSTTEITADASSGMLYVGNTGGTVTMTAKLPVPAGATVTSIAALVWGPGGVFNQYLYLTVEKMTKTATTYTVSTIVNSAFIQSDHLGVDTFEFVNYAPSALTVADDEWLQIHISKSTPDQVKKFYGIRVTYTQTAVRPET